MTKIADAAIAIHAQWLVLHRSRNSLPTAKTPVRHDLFQREIDRLAAAYADLRTIPARTPAEGAAKIRVLIGLFEPNGDLDSDALAILGEPVQAWLDRVADELETCERDDF